MLLFPVQYPTCSIHRPIPFKSIHPSYYSTMRTISLVGLQSSTIQLFYILYLTCYYSRFSIQPAAFRFHSNPSIHSILHTISLVGLHSINIHSITIVLFYILYSTTFNTQTTAWSCSETSVCSTGSSVSASCP